MKLSTSLLLAALGFATVPASADVVRSGFLFINIPTDFEGVYLDIDGMSFNFSDDAGSDVNPFFGGSEIATNPSFLPVRSGTGAFDAILNLPRGSIVGPATPSFSGAVFGGSTNIHMGTGPGQFEVGEVGYVGFQFMTNATPGPISGPYYGWMEVRFTNNTRGAVIQQWAFDNTGASLVVPEPSTCAALAGLAVIGLAVFRRRK